MYINSITDFNRAPSTDFTSDALTGNVTQIKFPLTRGKAPRRSGQPSITLRLEAAPSNKLDYYLSLLMQDEGGYTTKFTHDPTHTGSLASITPTAGTRHLATTHLDRCWRTG